MREAAGTWCWEHTVGTRDGGASAVLPSIAQLVERRTVVRAPSHP